MRKTFENVSCDICGKLIASVDADNESVEVPLTEIRVPVKFNRERGTYINYSMLDLCAECTDSVVVVLSDAPNEWRLKP